MTLEQLKAQREALQAARFTLFPAVDLRSIYAMPDWQPVSMNEQESPDG